MNAVIGIDPDSKKFACYYLKPGEDSGIKKEFYTTSSELEKFNDWNKSLKNVHIAVEGKNGQCSVLENFFNSMQIPFYSIPPDRINDFRKSMLGQNKNNWIDAEAVARYTLTLDYQGKLKDFQNKYKLDKELKILTREYSRVMKLHTSEINTLWKYLKEASPDLYLLLQGSNPEVEQKNNILNRMGILHLLGANMTINEWKSLEFSDFFQIMGNKNYVGRETLINNLQKISVTINNVSIGLCISIQQIAQRISIINKQIKQIENQLAIHSKKNKHVKKLMEFKGIGPVFASKIIAEIADINRFQNDDKLAAYAGIGLIENKTGDNENMKRTFKFNHLLKDAIMRGCMSHIQHSKQSPLADYYRALLKKKFKKMDALRRVSRSFIRKILRELKMLEQINLN